MEVGDTASRQPTEWLRVQGPVSPHAQRTGGSMQGLKDCIWAHVIDGAWVRLESAHTLGHGHCSWAHALSDLLCAHTILLQGGDMRDPEDPQRLITRSLSVLGSQVRGQSKSDEGVWCS